MKEKGEKEAGGEESPEEKKRCEEEEVDKALLGQSERKPADFQRSEWGHRVESKGCHLTALLGDLLHRGSATFSLSPAPAPSRPQELG